MLADPTPARRAVLLVNLGSPDSPSVPDVRRYLTEFLLDPRVIDIPWVLRQLLVRGAIIPKRVHNSAEAYHSIWTPEGSPLVLSSRRLRDLLAARVRVPVALAMRYGNPSIPDVIRNLAGDGVDDLLLIPLYPHYAMSSYETVVVRVREVLRRAAPGCRLTVQPPFYADPDYIAALVASARPWLDRPHDHLLFSYHGIPERHCRKADASGSHCLARPDCCDTPHPVHKVCYRHQVFATTRAFAALAGLSPERYSVSFQSRLGKDPWLGPYTDFELERLAKSGTRRLLLISPAFVSDCLETLEELGVMGKKTFLDAGGESFDLIPCLNEHPKWVEFLQRRVEAYSGQTSCPADGAPPGVKVQPKP
ncbi:MAG: ferrochelatase [Verrucomicrobiae bacterium]|nr:ferrochelatase [Verrucomicrobiae bacterium]